jgi:hypothetical protein
VALVDLAPLGEFALASALVLLIYAWLVTGGAVVNWLAAHVPSGHIGIPGLGGVNLFGWLHDGLVGFNNLAQNAYYFWLDAAKSSWNAWIVQVGAFVSQVTADYHFYATETLAALHWLRRTTIPTLVSVSVNPIWAAVHALQHLSRATVTDVTHVVKPVIQSITRDVTQRITRVEKITTVVAAAGAGAIATDIPRLWHGIGEAEGEAAKALRIAKEALNKFSIGSIVGLIGATIFTEFGLGWLRCAAVGRIGRALCGLGGLIENLFLDVVDVMLVSELCEIITLMTKGADEAAGFFDWIITTVDQLISCQKSDRPAAWTVTYYAPPPSAGLVTL